MQEGNLGTGFPWKSAVASCEGSSDGCGISSWPVISMWLVWVPHPVLTEGRCHAGIACRMSCSRLQICVVPISDKACCCVKMAATTQAGMCCRPRGQRLCCGAGHDGGIGADRLAAYAGLGPHRLSGLAARAGLHDCPADSKCHVLSDGCATCLEGVHAGIGAQMRLAAGSGFPIYCRISSSFAFGLLVWSPSHQLQRLIGAGMQGAPLGGLGAGVCLEQPISD